MSFMNFENAFWLPRSASFTQCDHISLAPGNHFAVLAALISIEDLFYADPDRRFGSSCWVTRFALGELGMLGRLFVTDVMLVGGMLLLRSGISVRLFG